MAQLKNGEEYLKGVFTGTRPEYKPHELDHSTCPESEVRQKAARANNWQICKSWIDTENKQFVYEVLVSANETEVKALSYDDVCKLFHWKKLEVIDNDQKVKWYADSAWDDKIENMMNRGIVNAAINRQKEKQAKAKEDAEKK